MYARLSEQSALSCFSASRARPPGRSGGRANWGRSKLTSGTRPDRQHGTPCRQQRGSLEAAGENVAGAKRFGVCACTATECLDGGGV